MYGRGKSQGQPAQRITLAIALVPWEPPHGGPALGPLKSYLLDMIALVADQMMKLSLTG